jgi:hypothetical protein
MTIIVELFGIPRQRAGTARIDAHGATLGEVLLDLTQRCPRLGEDCITGDGLRGGYLANLNG